MPLIILYTSIISPRQRLYLSVGKFKNFNRSLYDFFHCYCSRKINAVYTVDLGL